MDRGLKMFSDSRLGQQRDKHRQEERDKHRGERHNHHMERGQRLFR